MWMVAPHPGPGSLGPLSFSFTKLLLLKTHVNTMVPHPARSSHSLRKLSKSSWPCPLALMRALKIQLALSHYILELSFIQQQTVTVPAIGPLAALSKLPDL